MFKFALKNMAVKKVQVVLIVISVVLSAGVGVLAYNVSGQISDGITSNAGYYSAIIGPSGSATQLAMNTMYFTDEPLGTIPYSLVGILRQDSRMQTDENGLSDSSVIPFAMADSYNGSRVVGTTCAYLSGKNLKEGVMFGDSGSGEAVIGSEVARQNSLKIGDEIHTSHSATDVHSQGVTIVGILSETGTVYDSVVFTQIRTIWELHESEEEESEGHEDEHEMSNSVCAILIKAKNPTYALSIVNEYNGMVYTEGRDEDMKNYSIQAIEPMNTVRGVLDDVNTTKYIAYILCAIIIAMNIIIISIITLLNMYHSAKEISLMRLIGIGMGKINLLYIFQNGLIGIVSSILAFGLSRICLTFMSDFVASMGVSLNVSRVYPFELVILAAIFIISVLPTVICTSVMSHRDGIGE